MSNDKQSSVSQLIAEIQRRVAIIQSEPQTMARELMIDNLSVDLEQYEAMHKEEQEQLSTSWAKSREQTRESAMHIGFAKGFECALECWDDFYNELHRTDLDEDEFARNYITDRFEEIQGGNNEQQ